MNWYHVRKYLGSSDVRGCTAAQLSCRLTGRCYFSFLLTTETWHVLRKMDMTFHSTEMPAPLEHNRINMCYKTVHKHDMCSACNEQSHGQILTRSLPSPPLECLPKSTGEKNMPSSGKHLDNVGGRRRKAHL